MGIAAIKLPDGRTVSVGSSVEDEADVYAPPLLHEELHEFSRALGRIGDRLDEAGFIRSSKANLAGDDGEDAAVIIVEAVDTDSLREVRKLLAHHLVEGWVVIWVADRTAHDVEKVGAKVRAKDVCLHNVVSAIITERAEARVETFALKAAGKEPCDCLTYARAVEGRR